MRRYIYTIVIVLFAACSDEKKPSGELAEVPLKDGVTVRERIDGPANIRDDINGNILFELSDNVLVECGQINNDWFKVGAFVNMPKGHSEDGIIRKGESIYDLDGNPIGIAKSDLINWVIKEDQDAYRGFVEGYTFKGNIQPTSIVERELEKLLNAHEDLTRKFFENHIKEFAYREGGLKVEGYETLRQFSIYGSWIEDPSPIDRIRLMFDGDELIAIIHERELSMSGKASYPLIRGLDILIIRAFEDDELEIFIERNKRSYDGVD